MAKFSEYKFLSRIFLLILWNQGVISQTCFKAKKPIAVSVLFYLIYTVGSQFTETPGFILTMGLVDGSILNVHDIPDQDIF